MMLIRREWTLATGAAFAALEAGRRAEAASLLMDTSSYVERAGASAPLRAAARNNLGLARMLTADPHGALQDLKQAASQWATASELLDKTEIEISGRSSVFHLRLAMNQTDAFETVGRRRLERLCGAAAVVSHTNACVVRGESAHPATLALTMSEAFGDRSASTALLYHAYAAPTSDVNRAYAGYRHAAERAAEEMSSSYLSGCDYGADLAHAAQLTALIHPAFVPATGARVR